MPFLKITRKTRKAAVREAKRRYPKHVIQYARVVEKTYEIFMTPRRKK